MTDRDRDVTRLAVRVETAIRREARMNGEEVHEATPERVSRMVDEAADGDVFPYDWERLSRDVVTRVEEGLGVRRGWFGGGR